MKHTYTVESFYLGEWMKLFTEKRDYCLGYLDRAKYDAPRNNMRLRRSDGKVVCEVGLYAEVGIGQVAGFPTPEQYERAAERALEQAARIRAAQDREGARRAEINRSAAILTAQ